MSYRAEINFFGGFAGMLEDRGVRVPKVYHVVSEGVNKVPSDGGGGATASPAELEKDVMACRLLVLMEDFRPDTFRQVFELGAEDLEASLRLAARLHGATLEDEAVLRQASTDIFAEGGYWVPSKRDPGELDGLPEAWDGLMQSLEQEDAALFAALPRLRTLGTRLMAGSRFAGRELRGGDDEGTAASRSWRKKSLIHGDFKTANIFFDVRSGEAVPIDFQWTGVNYGVQDVAKLLLSSASLEQLAEGSRIEALLASYYASFVEAATQQAEARGESLEMDYDLDEIRRDFKLACLDYARVVFGYQLKGRDMDWVRRSAEVLGRCTHNRSVPHLLGLVRFLDRLLKEFESTGDLSGAPGSVPGFAE